MRCCGRVARRASGRFGHSNLFYNVPLSAHSKFYFHALVLFLLCLLTRHLWTVRHPLRRRQAHWLHRTRLRQRRWCILIPGEDLHCLPAEFRPDYFFKHIAPPFCTFPLLCSPLASTSRHCTWRPCFTAVTSPCSFFSPDRQRQAPKLCPCRQRHRVVSFRAHACLLACLWPGLRTVVEVVNHLHPNLVRGHNDIIQLDAQCL